MKLHSVFRLLVTVSVTLMVTVSAAQTQYPINCQGPVPQVFLHRNGLVWMNASAWLDTNGGWAQVCSLKTQTHGVDPVTCRAWLAFLTVATVTKQSINIWIDNTNQNFDCSNYDWWMAPSQLMLVGPN